MRSTLRKGEVAALFGLMLAGQSFSKACSILGEFWRFIGDNRAFLPIWFKPCIMRVPFDGSAPSDEELDERLERMLAKLEEGR